MIPKFCEPLRALIFQSAEHSAVQDKVVVCVCPALGALT